MAENRSDVDNKSEEPAVRDHQPEKAPAAVRRQTGRSPVRPPYEQFLRVTKVSKQ